MNGEFMMERCSEGGRWRQKELRVDSFPAIGTLPVARAPNIIDIMQKQLMDKWVSGERAKKAAKEVKTG